MQVQPNASENRVVRFEGGVWHVRIAAPPVKGKANRELIEFLSDILGVSKTGITIEKGMTSRRNVLRACVFPAPLLPVSWDPRGRKWPTPCLMARR